MWIDRQPVDGQVVVSLVTTGDEPLAMVIARSMGIPASRPALVVASSAWAGFRCAPRRRDSPNERTLVALPHPHDSTPRLHPSVPRVSSE